MSFKSAHKLAESVGMNLNVIIYGGVLHIIEIMQSLACGSTKGNKLFHIWKF
jgi:hypothetical protein